MGLGLSTGGKEGGKHPEKTPGGSVSTALCVPALSARNDSLLPQLAVGSPRHPDGAPPTLPGERRRLRPAEEGGRRGAAHLPPREEGRPLGFTRRSGRGGLEESGARRNQAGCQGEPRTSGGEPRQQRGQKAHASVAREGQREEGREGEGTGRPPLRRPRPARQRDRARTRARAPGRDPAPRADCVI